MLMIWSFPYSAGLQQLLRVCASFGTQYDIAFNPEKSFIVIYTTKEDQKLNFPNFYLADQVLDMRSKVKYLKSDLCDDDDDVKRQHCKLDMQANIRPPKFYMCTDDVKVDLFKPVVHMAHLWCNYSKVLMKKTAGGFSGF